MKTAAEIANHPRARLARQVVEILRASGSSEGAMQAWKRLPQQRHLWRRITVYGLATGETQRQLTQIAFAEFNRDDVDAALSAGNRLSQVYELACGRASIARDATDRLKVGRKGWKIVLLSRRRDACSR
jgi:hypothetical protein